METLPQTPSRRLHARQAYGRAADAFDTAAWRAPTARRFDARVANDRAIPEPAPKAFTGTLPAWVMVTAGGLVAALMGAMLGGMLHI